MESGAGHLLDSGTCVKVTRACGRTVLSLPTSEVVEQVLGEAGDHLRDGQVVLDTTTGDPERSAAVGARLAGRGVHYLDAAIAGSSEQVRAAVNAVRHQRIVLVVPARPPRPARQARRVPSRTTTSRSDKM